MNYQEAKNLRVGDIVVISPTNERHKVVDIDDKQGEEVIFIKCENRIIYHHKYVLSLDNDKRTYDKYYQVLSFNPENMVDDVCSSHIYPSYLTCFGVKSGMRKPFDYQDIVDKPLMLQSNPHDGLKFVEKQTAERAITLAKTIFPQKEFVVIELPSLFYGKIQPKWIVRF